MNAKCVTISNKLERSFLFWTWSWTWIIFSQCMNHLNQHMFCHRNCHQQDPTIRVGSYCVVSGSLDGFFNIVESVVMSNNPERFQPVSNCAIFVLTRLAFQDWHTRKSSSHSLRKEGLKRKVNIVLLVW